METEGAKLWILREVLQLVDADSVSSMPEAGDAASQIQETGKIPLEKRSCEVQLRANLVTSTCLSRCAKTMKTRSESLWGRWTCKRIFVALRFFVLDLSSPRERERERERGRVLISFGFGLLFWFLTLWNFKRILEIPNLFINHLRVNIEICETYKYIETYEI